MLPFAAFVITLVWRCQFQVDGKQNVIAHLNLVTLGRTDCFAAALPPSVNGQHPGMLRGGFVEGESKKKKKRGPGRRAQSEGGRGMVEPGVGGNWQAIAKATSYQDNALGHRCPSIPTLMLIAFQCLWDNLSNNCFSCVNSGLQGR